MFSHAKRAKLTLIFTYIHVAANGKIDEHLTLNAIKIDTHQDLVETLKFLDAEFKEGRIGEHTLTVKADGHINDKRYDNHELKGIEAFRDFVAVNQAPHHDSKWSFMLPTF